MPTPANTHYTVEICQDPHAGTPWIVKVFRKALFGRKRISSDWFLDEQQARRFASQLSDSLNGPDKETVLRDRKPGWTLRRPIR